MIPRLAPRDPFPPVAAALKNPPGLLAAGADLSAARLVDAYRRGIFPWFGEGDPILWWSTDPRMVLFTDELRISHSLKKRLARSIDDPAIEIRCDHAFEAVIAACAGPRHRHGSGDAVGGGGTWIVDEIIGAYVALHRLGVAHSVETWVDGQLVGGLYGIAIGRMFYGESMFALATDASKIALAHLVAFARSHAMPMLDCQQQTAHLASMGARAIPRADFVARITDLIDRPAIAAWPDRLVWSRIATGPSHPGASLVVDHPEDRA